MEEAMFNTLVQFLNALQPIDTAVSLLNTVFIFITFWVVTFGRKRRIKKIFQSLRSEQGSKPGILMIDLVRTADISADVERFRLSDAVLKEIPRERIFKIERSKDLSSADILSLVEEIRKARRFFSGEAVDVIHFFYGGPVIIPALVGAEFNSLRMTLYQRNVHTSSWDNWGPLRHPEVN
jgi:hypothetical protein